MLLLVRSPSVFLIDNGSLRPEATIALRALAGRLSERAGALVEAVSLLHSHKVPAEYLHGEAATIVKRRMRALIAEGQRRFRLLPLFLGPSLAITDYLPQVIEGLRAKTPGLDVRIAAPLAGGDVEQPDGRLAQILADHVAPLLEQMPQAKLALVDHGSPIEPVNRLRDAVARRLGALLGRAAQPCSMERRDGPEYDFNEPLLENLGRVQGLPGGPLILAMFFLLPGRHAGRGGDVATLAEGLVEKGVFTTVEATSLLSEHPLLLEALADRLFAISDTG